MRRASAFTTSEELSRLRDENAVLRASAVTFGELAERLNAQLKCERLLFAMMLTAISQQYPDRVTANTVLRPRHR